MRLRFNSRRFYLDNEWGFVRNLPKEEAPEVTGPPVDLATPMIAYEPVRVGFRTTGPDQGFTTGDAKHE